VELDVNNDQSNRFQLRQSLTNICITLVMKCIAKNQNLYTSEFVNYIAKYSKLPLGVMKEVSLMTALFTSVKQGKL